MQTKQLFLVSGIHSLPLRTQRARCPIFKGTKMSDTTSFRLTASSTLFGRLMATIDRLLMASAEIAIRNGDLPRVGL
jgi:hypothetical protein